MKIQDLKNFPIFADYADDEFKECVVPYLTEMEFAAGEFICRQLAILVGVTRGEKTHRIKPAIASFPASAPGAFSAGVCFRYGNSVYTWLCDFAFVRDTVNML